MGARSRFHPERNFCLKHYRTAMLPPKETQSNKSFGGFTKQFTHESTVCQCTMTFSVFFPPATGQARAPVLYYLSGLSCTDRNAIEKSGLQRKAAQLHIAVVTPDTSPRGLNISGEDDDYDFGTSAGFYLNATQDKWKAYRMYDYITKELPEVLRSFPELDVDKASITGHSMGGHGALVLGLRNPQLYKSISAFAPIGSPSQVPWGEKAFKGYLGSNKEAWKQYDATELVQKDGYGNKQPILIDVGTSDKFLESQLQPEKFQKGAQSSGVEVNLRYQEGYDHSYFFIASFIDDHLEHAAKALQA